MVNVSKIKIGRRPFFTVRSQVEGTSLPSLLAGEGEPDTEELLLAYESQKNVIQQLQVRLKDGRLGIGAHV